MKRLLLLLAGTCGFASVTAAQEGATPEVPARLVSIEVTLAEFDPSLWPAQDAAEAGKLLESLRAAEGQDKVFGLTQIRLSALEHQPASAHWGERVAVPSGRISAQAALEALRSGASSGFGSRVSPQGAVNYVRENMGTIVGATCRIDEGGLIVIELNVEQSRLAADTEVKLDPSDPDASALLKPVTKTLKTTVSVPDGQTLLLGGMTTRSGKQLRQDVLLVTARVIGATPVKAAAAREAVKPATTAKSPERSIRRVDQ